MFTNGPAKKPITLPEIPPCCGKPTATGRCDPLHPLHCCHLVTTTWETAPDITYVCVKCGKTPGITTNMKTGKLTVIPRVIDVKAIL